MANDISGIDSSRTQQAGERNVSGAKKESTSSTSSSPTSSGADKISLTDTAARLKALEHQLTKQSEIDDNRVSNVQEAISNGNYKVDPERVADKMISFEASFGKRN